MHLFKILKSTRVSKKIIPISLEKGSCVLEAAVCSYIYRAIEFYHVSTESNVHVSMLFLYYFIEKKNVSLELHVLSTDSNLP